jgi:hypothetical protein
MPIVSPSDLPRIWEWTEKIVIAEPQTALEVPVHGVRETRLQTVGLG